MITVVVSDNHSIHTSRQFRAFWSEWEDYLATFNLAFSDDYDVLNKLPISMLCFNYV